MALQWLEGFSLFNSVNSFALKGYSLSNYGATYSLPTGRAGQKAQAFKIVNGMYTSGGNNYACGNVLSIPVLVNSGVAGFAIQWVAVSGGSYSTSTPEVFFAVTDSKNNVQFALGYPNNNTIELCGPRDTALVQFTLSTSGSNAVVYDPAGNSTANVLATSSGYSFTTGTWHFIEVGFQSGAVTVRANGTQVINYTGGATSGIFNNFIFGTTLLSPLATGPMWTNNYLATVMFDDIYILDYAGNINNTYLGNSYVQGIQPTGDNLVQWTKGGSSNPATNAAAVANPDPSTTTGYIQSNTSGTEDRYTLAQASGTIYGVQINWAAVQQSSTGRIAPVVNISNTDYIGVYRNTSVTATGVYSQVYDQDPTNNPWTKSTVTNSTFGLIYITP